MNLTFKVLAASVFLTMGMQAQTPGGPVGRGCATPVPGAEWDSWFNTKVTEYKQNVAANKTASPTYTVPVIVHVIHGGQNVGVYPNISQAQVNSQIAVLNADFAGIGLNVGNLAVTGFSNAGPANCGITFMLATVDPNGNPLSEPGIDRVNYTSNSWTNPASITSQGSFQSYVDGTIKPGTVWDPARYGNIWVTDVNTNVNLLGYATFPVGSGLSGVSSNFGTANTDGIWVWSKAFGNTGNVQAPYHKGRTATHELGHWLGLRHIGGDSNPPSCNSNDYCNDTPPQKGGFGSGQFGQNYGAPTYPLYATGSNACSLAPYGNMFMNFMDYVDDPSCYMFTYNQADRINTAMLNGTYRNQLTASASTMNVLPETMPVADFAVITQGCVDSLITVSNQSSGSPTPTYLWSITPNNFSGSFNPNNSAVSPNLSFSALGTFTVTMMATNSAGTTSTSKVITVNDCSDGSTGIAGKSVLQKSIVLSPNPTSGILTISSSSTENLTIEVRNYLGQFITSVSVKDASTGTSTIDLTNYTNGVYFVTVSNGQEKIVKRVILNK